VKVSTNDANGTIIDYYSRFLLASPMRASALVLRLLPSPRRWTVCLSETPRSSTTRSPTCSRRGRLLAYFDFNENYGLSAVSSVNQLEAFWHPYVRTDGATDNMAVATQHWGPSPHRWTFTSTLWKTRR
jgi:hypothetical protein